MLVIEEKSTRIVLKSEFSEAWEELRGRTGISQQELFDRMLRFLFQFDDITQSMMLGIIEARPDLLKFVLEKQSVAGTIKPTTSASGKRTESQNQAAKKFPRGGKS
jgi:hypothetical protein